MADFSFGIEEEFFLSHARTRNACTRMPKSLLARCSGLGAGRIAAEMLQLQIETNTAVCTTMEEARQQVAQLRRTLIEAAAEHELTVLAAGTHPLAAWTVQLPTRKSRYKRVFDELRIVGWRSVLCGLHVHVGVPELSRRVEIMTRAVAFLPLLLGLSVSSPFWQRRPTGLKGYRLAAYDENPRTGFPPTLESAEAYDSYVATLIKAGIIPDASHIWWALRPSLKYPTLEFRVMDSCTRLDDVLVLAALCRCLVRRLHRDPAYGVPLSPQYRALAEENRWRVQRTGTEAAIIDLATLAETTFRDAVARLVADLVEDAEALGCAREVEAADALAAGGTSADRQLAVYQEARTDMSRRKALDAVVDWLVETTARVDGAA
jgi:carboxylate-amine ligase